MDSGLTGDWLTCEQFAELANLPVRTARHAMKKASTGTPVKRWPIIVRTQPGRGGKAGRRYEVALSSLPEAYQAPFSGGAENDLQLPAIGRAAPVAPNQGSLIEYRYRVIQEALDQPRRSPDRKAEIERASRKWGVPVRTIHRWIADLEAAGGDANALGRKKPTDAGARRVWVSRRFDRAYRDAGYPDDQLPALGDAVALLIKRGWTSPAQRAGWKAVRREVITAFKRDLAARGIALAARD